MGMETLNSAARAAGFAMAVSDETQTATEPKAETPPTPPAGETDAQRRERERRERDQQRSEQTNR